MASLTGQSIASSYEQLLSLPDGGGNTTTLVAVTDGDAGTTFAMQLSTTTVCIDNPTADSSTQGGILRLQSDDGALMQSGSRLGVIEFAGAEDSSSTITVGGRIESVTDAAWSATENGADMVFYTTDGNASQSEVMRLTADNLVGIGGVAAPDTKLHIQVSDASAGTNPYAPLTVERGDHCGIQLLSGATHEAFLLFGDSGSNDAGKIGYDHDGDAGFYFNVASTTRMVIDSSGNVGIGTSSPSSILNLKSATGASSVLTIDTTDAGDGNSDSIIALREAGTLKWYMGNDGSDSDSFKISNTGFASNTRVTLTSAGNVGIGESVPLGRLHVKTADSSGTVVASADEFVIEGSAHTGMTILAGTSHSATIAFGDSGDNDIGQIGYDHGGNSLFFTANATTVARLDGNSRISLSNNDSGTSNTIFGKNAGDSDGAGDLNVFIGELAGGTGTQTDDADSNVGIGYRALTDLTEGVHNVAIGKDSATNMLGGDMNIAIGSDTLYTSTAAIHSIAIGKNAMYAGTASSSTGSIAIGYDSLRNVSSGVGNVAVGYQSLTANTVGNYNTAVGYQALDDANDNSDNTAVGYQALTLAHHGTADQGQNTAVGKSAGDVITTGTKCTIIGSDSDPGAADAVNQTIVGYGIGGVADTDNSVVLGNSDVNYVFMGQDEGATVLCAGVRFDASGETLGDYEEGTVTVAFTAGSGTITIHSSYDQVLYTKIGNLVTVTGGLTVSAISSPSGELTMTGLPFTCKAQTNGYDSIPATTVYLRDAASDIANYVTGFVNQNTTNLILREGGTTGSGGDLAAHVDTGTIIYIQLSYFTA